MKKLILFAVLTVVTIVITNAQPAFNLYPDSIRVEMPELNAIVVFEMREYQRDPAQVQQFPAYLRKLLDQVKSGFPTQVAATTSLRIEVSEVPEEIIEVGLTTKPVGEKQLIRITAITMPVTHMTITKERGIVELLPPGWEVLISSDKRKIRVYAVDFAGLEKITLQDFSVVTTALESEEKMKKLGRNSIGSVMTLEQNKVTQKSMKYTFPGDQIFLTAKGGVGLFRDKLYPELTAVLGLTFRDRYRRPNIRPSISYNYMFFAERSTEGFAMNTNSFLSGSFEFNSNKKESTPSWSGIGVGWLMRRNGDYFTGNTAKFFITQTLPNSRLQLVPEFYLTDDLKKFAFGVGMKFSF